MRREWEPEDLLACWTLMDPDRQLLANKAGATRLGFAVLLKFFELEARFPRHGGEVPPVAVAYLAQQVGVEAAVFTRYGWSGRAVKYHRAQIRQALGFRESTVADEDRLAAWLAAEVCPVELREEALREAVAARCRAERIEPPGAALLRTHDPHLAGDLLQDGAQRRPRRLPGSDHPFPRIGSRTTLPLMTPTRVSGLLTDLGLSWPRTCAAANPVTCSTCSSR